MVVNFRVCEISRGTHKLTRTPTLIFFYKKVRQIDQIQPDLFLSGVRAVIIKILVLIWVRYEEENF
jgi:hypothetical protein